MTPDFMREGEEPEMQTIDLPDVGSSPRNLGQSPAPRQVVPTFDSGEGTTPTGTMASLREQFPAPARLPRKNLPEPQYADNAPDLTPGKKRIDGFPDYSMLASRFATPPEKAYPRGFPPEPEFNSVSRASSPWADEPGELPPMKSRGLLADADEENARIMATVPSPESPQVSPPASGSMGDPSVRAASKVPATPGAPDPTAMATPGSTTSPAVMSQYEALKRAFAGGGGDEPDYSGVVRGAEDVYAALANKKADYRVADEMAADRKARAAAPMRKLAQEQMLEQVRQAETPLPDSYLDQLGAPHGLNKAQLKEFLDRRETVASIKQKERAPALSAEAMRFADWREKNPDAPISEYESQTRQVLAAKTRGDIASAIQDKKTEIANKQLEAKKAEGVEKRKLEEEIAEKNYELKKLQIAATQENAKATREMQVGRAKTQQITKLRNEEEKLRGVAQSIESVKELLPEDSDKLPGRVAMATASGGTLYQLAGEVAAGAGLIPEAEREKAVALWQRVSRLLTLQGLKDSGVTLRKEEEDRLKSLLGAGIAQDPKKIYEALNIVSDATKRSYSALKSAYSQGQFPVWEDYVTGAEGSVYEPDSDVFKPLAAGVAGKGSPSTAERADVTPTRAVAAKPAAIPTPEKEQVKEVLPAGRLEAPIKPTNPTGAPEDEPILVRGVRGKLGWIARKDLLEAKKKGVHVMRPEDEPREAANE
jgi:hypothetical protein